MIKAQISPRTRLHAKIAGDVVSGTLKLQTKVAIPSGKRQYIKPSDGFNGLDTVIVEGVPDANAVSFPPTQITPDAIHSIGYNWFAQVVERIQPMVGTKRNMTPAEIIYWLKKVKYIPQGFADASFSLRFDAVTATRLPNVVRSTAGSAFTISFESNAQGV